MYLYKAKSQIFQTKKKKEKEKSHRFSKLDIQFTMLPNTLSSIASTSDLS